MTHYQQLPDGRINVLRFDISAGDKDSVSIGTIRRASVLPARYRAYCLKGRYRGTFATVVEATSALLRAVGGRR